PTTTTSARRWPRRAGCGCVVAVACQMPCRVASMDPPSRRVPAPPYPPQRGETPAGVASGGGPAARAGRRGHLEAKDSGRRVDLAPRRSTQGRAGPNGARRTGEIIVKYMLIMRSSDEAEAAFQEADISFEQMIETMGRFNEEMITAGVLVA